MAELERDTENCIFLSICLQGITTQFGKLNILKYIVKDIYERLWQYNINISSVIRFGNAV